MAWRSGRRVASRRGKAPVSFTAPSAASRIAAAAEPLEPRRLLSAALDLIGVTAMRNDPSLAGIDGRGVSVAVIDTGVDASHPLLAPNFVTGFDFFAESPNVTLTGDHGTHVAGIVGGQPSPANGYDGGVATGAGLIGLQVFTPDPSGRPRANNRDIEEALQWVEANRAQYNIVAVNMSLGAGFFRSPGEVAGDLLEDDIRRLEAAGVTVVSAAGNSYGAQRDFQSGQLIDRQYPNSGAPGILSTLNVGAVWEGDDGGPQSPGASFSFDVTTAGDRVASFSQRPPTDVGNAIFAPGALILSTVPGGFADYPGTSMASPMVAGAVALVQQAAQQFGGRLLSAIEVRDVLLATGDTIVDGDDEDDRLIIDGNGNGQIDQGEIFDLTNTGGTYKRVNVYNAVRRVRDTFGSGGPAPDPNPDPGNDNGADPNGTFDTAVRAPALTGAAVAPLRGVIGADGATPVEGDVDMYVFDLEAPGTVRIETQSDPQSPADFDSVLRLFNAFGTEVASADDGGAGNFSLLTADLPVGTYFVGVSGFSNVGYDPNVPGSGTAGANGNYALQLSVSSADPNGLLGGAVPVSLGTQEQSEVFQGFIGADFGADVGQTDVDIFQVVVPDDGTLFIDIDTPFESGFVDSFLRIFDADGNPLVNSDDDLATDLADEQVEFPEVQSQDPTTPVRDAGGALVGHVGDSFVAGGVSRGDVYYVAVSDFQNQDYDPNTLAGRSPAGPGGQYQLHVQFANNDRNGSIPQAVTPPPLPAENREGRIGTDGDPQTGQQVDVGDRDVDFIRLNSPAGGVMEFDVDSYTMDGNDDPLDTVLMLYDGEGNLLASNDDTREGPDPMLRFEIAANTDYFVAVAAYGNENFDPFMLGSGSSGETGNYRFSARTIEAAQALALVDDTSQAGAVRNIAENSEVEGVVGQDDGFSRGPDDVDLYRFAPAATGSVRITAGPADEFGADTVLRVFNASGAEIAFNDDVTATSTSSEVNVPVQAGQTYLIGVNGFSNGARSYNPITGEGATAGSTGDYALAVGAVQADGGAAPTVSVGDVTVPESGADFTGTATFTVSLSAPAAAPVTMNYATADGTATGGADYTPASGPLTFAPGETSKLVIIQVTNDTSAESNETFVLNLSGASGATIADGQGSATITDDDGGTTPPPTADGPDLVVSVVPSVRGAILAGSTKGRAAVRVTNQGNEPLAANVGVRLVLSADATPDAGDPTLIDLPARLLRLREGASKNLKASFTFPQAPDDDYVILAVVDPGNAVPERNETNNTGAGPSMPVAAAFVDLVAGTLTAPTSLSAGGRGRATLLVRNDGNVNARATVPVRLFASADATAGGPDDILIGTVPGKLNLRPGAGKPVRLSFTVPGDLVSGTEYHLVVAVDDPSGLAERNETNNTVVGDGTFVVG